MKYYKLIDAINIPITISVAITEGTYAKYGTMRLEPKTKYKTNDDELLINSLKKQVRKVMYNQEFENALKDGVTEYRVEVCGTCGGKKKHIIYNPVELFDE